MGRTWVHRDVVGKGQWMEVNVVQGTQEKKEKAEPGFHRGVKCDSNYWISHWSIHSWSITDFRD
jgi:hypothetical protein